LRVVDVVFCGGFCENGCAERGFLRGKRGAVVVICVAGSDSKEQAENGTAFFQISGFIFMPVTPALSRANVSQIQQKGRPKGRPF
jgi:hypothetical protein